jgi:hypothetical protein
MNGNGIPDPVETARMYMDQSMNNAKVAEGEGKLALQAQKQMQEAKAHEDKMWIEKEKVLNDRMGMQNERAMFEREQNQQDLQNQREMKMQQAEHQQKLREGAQKMALEKYKIKNKPKPKSAAKK